MPSDKNLAGLVTLKISDGRAYVTIDRPEKRNALAFEMFDRLVAHLNTAVEDDDVRVIVIKGGGEDFCSGHDLSQVFHVYGDKDGSDRRPSQRARLYFDRRLLENYRSVLYCDKPIISAVKGYCIGAGLHIVEASDLAVAAEDSKIGHPEQRMAFGGAAFLTTWDMAFLGAKKARELLLLGRLMNGSEAAEAGLINRAVPRNELDKAVEEYAETIVRIPRDAIAIGKAATHLALDSLGMSSQFFHGYITHTLATNIRFEKDEFNFISERRKSGARDAFHKREQFYAVDKT